MYMSKNNKLKELVKKKGYTIARLSHEANMPYSTVNDIVNGTISVDNVGLGKCKTISDVLGITLDAFFDLYNNVINIGDGGIVVVKNHAYYLKYKDKEKYIFKANAQNSFFVKEVATWDYEDMVAQDELDNLASAVLSEKEID